MKYVLLLLVALLCLHLLDYYMVHVISVVIATLFLYILFKLQASLLHIVYTMRGWILSGGRMNRPVAPSMSQPTHKVIQPQVEPLHKLVAEVVNLSYVYHGAGDRGPLQGRDVPSTSQLNVRRQQRVFKQLNMMKLRQRSGKFRPLFNLASNESIVVYNEESRTAIIGVRGTSLKTGRSRRRDLKADADILFDSESKIINERIATLEETIRKLRDMFGNNVRILLGGHSLGGTIVYRAFVRSSLVRTATWQVHCFNAGSAPSTINFFESIANKPVEVQDAENRRKTAELKVSQKEWTKLYIHHIQGDQISAGSIAWTGTIHNKITYQVIITSLTHRIRAYAADFFRARLTGNHTITNAIVTTYKAHSLENFFMLPSS